MKYKYLSQILTLFIIGITIRFFINNYSQDLLLWIISLLLTMDITVNTGTNLNVKLKNNYILLMENNTNSDNSSNKDEIIGLDEVTTYHKNLNIIESMFRDFAKQEHYCTSYSTGDINNFAQKLRSSWISSYSIPLYTALDKTFTDENLKNRFKNYLTEKQIGLHSNVTEIKINDYVVKKNGATYRFKFS